MYCQLRLVSTACLLFAVSSTLSHAAPQARAIAIGLNSVDPGHYGGWSGDLQACEFDANDMAAIASSQGFTVEKLLTSAATRQAMMTAFPRQLPSSLVETF